MCVKGPNIFETWGLNMRLARNMYSFAKMFVSYSSSQLLVVLASALKPQFKVAMYHRSFSHITSTKQEKGCSLGASWSSPAPWILFHPASLILVRKGDRKKEMLTSVWSHICSQPSCIQSPDLAVGKKQVLIAQSFEV